MFVVCLFGHRCVHMYAHRCQARILRALGDWNAAAEVYQDLCEAAQKLPVREQPPSFMVV